MASSLLLQSSKSLFNQYKSGFSNLSRIPLLKKIVSVTDEIFATHQDFQQDLNILGEEKQSLVAQAAIHQNFEGITDFTEEFYKIVDVCNKRQQLARDFVYLALEKDSGVDHLFNKFDSALLRHAAMISGQYHPFYVKWMKAVQGNKVAEELEKRASTIDRKLTNSYTIILLDEATNEFYDVSYGEFFKNEFAPIINQFSELLNDLYSLRNSGENYEDLEAYIKYIEKYRETLIETDKEKLETLNTELDELWMDVKSYIQYVHDIEYGYGDVLRCKSIPDFSCRLVDEEYESTNNFIKTKVQGSMVEYFKSRNTEIADNGIYAVENSMCSIYSIPFHCGQSLSFKFSGQSIPNRTEVKNKKGVKIYFDPVATESRRHQTISLVNKVCENSEELASYINTIDTIKNHIAAHEIGHAIYNLEFIKEHIKVDTKSLLEEPRAELTALFTMRLLHKNGHISSEELSRSLASFAMQDFRRFAMFDKSSLRPYIISAISTYKIYEKLGYVTIKDDKLHFDHSKSDLVLSNMGDLFERILDCEDKRSGEELEKILKDMQSHSPLVDWLVNKLFITINNYQNEKENNK
ncbi:predicted protein [Naegleria gruberi]|uniref:Predicted protein n=1 Tax=Naegleria gruberi TaxID=5762 RepID=D2VKF9_NAEGR|nr:uncharacterized protein NAEGRDRAFT_80304 [Naegleria gruberi]EFC42681.1 predicted protein [Naegleria gruberi]|eukprot:XP_002675425.1 predicted protein [Naegleria gruberi strain NEG-M]